MKNYLIALGMAMLSMTFISCEEGDDLPLTKLEGHYTGTFQRTVGNEAGQVAQVTINFANNTWEGHSDTYQYPALCNGTFLVKERIISFENLCMFTADFDWTLILKGDYEIIQTSDAITMTKVYPQATAQIKDVYTLKLSTPVN